MAWLGETTRPTRDIDLLGFGDQTAGSLAGIFAELCAIEVAPDGMTFDPGSIRVAPIRPEDAYGGNRVALLARLGSARLRVQVDVGIGDAVTPQPEWLEYPSLLDLPRPRLRAYRRETAIAEKLHAMVVLGSKNSRMRDFFDVQALAARESFDGELLANAIRATFERRKIPLPGGAPLALSPHFALIGGKPEQWAGFVRRSRPGMAVDGLGEVVEQIRAFLGPVLTAMATGRPFQSSWPPGGPWRQATRGAGPRLRRSAHPSRDDLAAREIPASPPRHTSRHPDRRVTSGRPITLHLADRLGYDWPP